MEGIFSKIDSLDIEQRKNYLENLRNICEFRDECILYGAKDPVNLPKDDFERIQVTLYNQMFGESYKTREL